MAATTPLSVSAISRLHRNVINSPQAIAEILRSAANRGAVLRNGIDRKNRPRRASMLSVQADRLVVQVENIEATAKNQLFFNFDSAGIRYFFASYPHKQVGRQLHLAFPSAIYEVERRDSRREPSNLGEWVRLKLPNGQVRGRLIDESDDGLGLSIASSEAEKIVPNFEMEFPRGPRSGKTWFASVCHRREGEVETELGLRVSSVRSGLPVSVERRSTVMGDEGQRARLRRRFDYLASAAAGAASGAAGALGFGPGDSAVRILRVETSPGREITAILNGVGDPCGAPVVLIPPAWGRTKETLLPLAETICETFQNAGRPVLVVRFDGTARRGESWIPEDCRGAGEEYLQFRFSRAVQDIRAVTSFLRDSGDFKTTDVALVTFSLAAVEGRRSIAADTTGMFRGWVPVVGMADLQSGLKAVSGGVDYAYGLKRGVEFGRHELVGVLADMTSRAVTRLRMISCAWKTPVETWRR